MKCVLAVIDTEGAYATAFGRHAHWMVVPDKITLCGLVDAFGQVIPAKQLHRRCPVCEKLYAAHTVYESQREVARANKYLRDSGYRPEKIT